MKLFKRFIALTLALTMMGSMFVVANAESETYDREYTVNLYMVTLRYRIQGVISDTVAGAYESDEDSIWGDCYYFSSATYPKLIDGQNITISTNSVIRDAYVRDYGLRVLPEGTETVTYDDLDKYELIIGDALAEYIDIEVAPIDENSIWDRENNQLSFKKAGTYLLTVAVESDNHPDVYYYNEAARLFNVVEAEEAQEATETQASITAAPTASAVLVDGEEASFEAYNIADTNYFKLRDIAYILDGTDANFELTWNAEAGAIEILSGTAYTAVGGEMAAGDGTAKEAIVSTASIYLDGVEIEMEAYTINDNNYFKLRDLGETLGFNVTWDAEAGSIVIASDEEYTAD